MGEDQLRKILFQNSVSDSLIDDVINSGYFIRDWVDPFSGKTWQSVSDKFYGNKGISSNLDIQQFINYIKGNPVEYKTYPFVTYKVKTLKEIEEILNDQTRKKLFDAGKMSFRGQSSEHLVSRKIPNPIRRNKKGSEISIMPGIFRNSPLGKSKIFEYQYKSSFKHLIHEIEPNGESDFFSAQNSHDLMRVEQHYATNTAGLDITFDIHSALFFATHKYDRISEDKATYKKIETGEHHGCIYCLVFTDPPVKRTEFYITSFDFFKTNHPERILRQDCGLPLFNEYERNIAITDINCIIYLDEDFKYDYIKSYEFMFPNTLQDKFYKKVLDLKTLYPDRLKNLIEYV